MLREVDRPDWEWQTGSILRVVVRILQDDFHEEVSEEKREWGTTHLV